MRICSLVQFVRIGEKRAFVAGIAALLVFCHHVQAEYQPCAQVQKAKELITQAQNSYGNLPCQQDLINSARNALRDTNGCAPFSVASELSRLATIPTLSISDQRAAWADVLALLKSDDNRPTALENWLLVNALEQTARIAAEQGEFKLAKVAADNADRVPALNVRSGGQRYANEVARLEIEKHLNFGHVHAALYDSDSAIQDFDYALTLARKNSNDSIRAVEALVGLSQIYRERGNVRQALEYSSQAVPLANKTKYPHDETRFQFGVEAWSEIGLCYLEQRQFSKAEDFLTNALILCQRFYPTNHYETGRCYANLGDLAWRESDFVSAVSNYQTAVSIFASDGSKAVPAQRRTLQHMSLALLDLQKTSEAVAGAREYERLFEKEFDQMLDVTSEDQRVGYQSEVNAACNLSGTLAGEDPLLIARASLRLKGGILESLMEDWKALADADIPVHGAFKLTDIPVMDRFRDFEAEMVARRHSHDGARSALELRDLQNALPTNAVLIDFVAYNHYLGRRKWEGRYGAVVMEAGHPLRWVPLATRESVNTNIISYEQALRDGPEVSDAGQSWLKSQTYLYRNIWLPVAKKLSRETRTILICPDDEIGGVSFASLWGGAGFVANRFDVHYVTAPRDILPRSKNPVKNNSFVAFADADYDTAVETLAANNKTIWLNGIYNPQCLSNIWFRRLAATQNEAQTVSEEAKRSGFDPIAVYLGTNASKAMLRRIHKPGILHLATHGYWLASDPFLRFAQTNASLVGSTSARFNAMMDGWLLLAGANSTLSQWRTNAVPDPANDGILRADEVARLDLQGTWLVSLVACNSGIGVMSAGDGVFGLRRAFAMAGAQNVLGAFWPVDDAFSSEFVASFYDEALKPPQNAAAAMANVQRHYLGKIRNERGILEAVRLVGPYMLNSFGQ